MTSSNINKKGENGEAKKTSNFSIEHILNKAGNSEQSADANNTENVVTSSYSLVPFPWLHCTRYCPPKIPRTQKKETPQKRQLGRHPRIPFSSQQLAVLEERFRQSPYLSSQEVTQLSRSLQLADIRVKIWFQNRRARERRERMFPSSDNLENKDLVLTRNTSGTPSESTVLEAPLSTRKSLRSKLFQSSTEETQQNRVEDCAFAPRSCLFNQSQLCNYFD